MVFGSAVLNTKHLLIDLITVLFKLIVVIPVVLCITSEELTKIPISYFEFLLGFVDRVIDFKSFQ